MKQLTIRGMDEPLEQALRDLAAREGISLSQAALRLMKRGADLTRARSRNVIGHRLDRFIGTMTEDEERELLDAVSSCSQVDEAFWR